MKTKEKVLEELQNEVKSMKKKQEDEIKSKIILAFARIVIKIILISFAVLLVSIACIAIFVESEIPWVLFITLMWCAILIIFVWGFWKRVQRWYVNKKMNSLSVEPIDIDDNVKKLIVEKIGKLTNEIFDLELALSEAKEELILLEEIQKERN